METMFMQNFGGQTKSIMVFLKVANEDLRYFETPNRRNVKSRRA